MNMNRSAVRWLVLGLMVLCFSAASMAQVLVSVRIGPPALPVYAQPICPGPGYFWTPGYWAWNDDGGYYWVPGTWVVAPVGLLWTPGYWGWGGGFYLWHAGYWGPHVGFYGGINYGYGYPGVGFGGGEWRGNNFYYNRSVTNVSVTNVTNVYNKTVIVNNTSNVSYNGGTGGLAARPTAQEEAYGREQHQAPVAAQAQQERIASQNRQNFASENHGRPAIAATSRAGDFSGRSVVAARAAGGEYRAPAMSPKEARGPSRPANNTNRAGGNSAPSGQNRSNEGFRPFTPPSKSGSAGGNNHGGNNANGGNSANRGNNANGGEFRPFNSNGGNQNRGNGGNQSRGFNPPKGNDSRPQGASRPNDRSPVEHGPVEHGPSQSRPQGSPQHTAPPQEHRSSPPPHNEGAPKGEHRG